VIQPLAPARYKVQFTASACFREKMERLTALMRPSVPDGDLAKILEEAVTEKLERLEAKRFANTNRPRKNANEVETGASSRYIPAPIKRIVCARDGNQCTFIDRTGRRCPHSADNVVLMCRAHNAYRAELDYGRKTMDRYRGSDRVSESAVAYC
jgi:hypothetical protein